MAIHDAHARRTPYELLLPDEEFAGKRFAAVEAEARERGVDDLGDPERFVMLMAVGEILRELKGPEDEAERIRQHGLLLFHAYHFREAGKPLWLLPTAAARYLVEASAPPAAEPAPPTTAGYLQLPQHLFWARPGHETGDAEAVPESLDGAFWTVGSGRVSVLAVLGVRGDRPGFSVVPLSGLPLDDAPSWARTDMREGPDPDFRSEMPGAEIDALYEVRTPGEILKLLARAWGLMDREGDEGRGPPEGVGEGPPPSRLPYHRISLEPPRPSD